MTALVCVDPTSTPAPYAMTPSLGVPDRRLRPAATAQSPSKNASTRFLSCASDTTRRSIMSDSMNRLGTSRSAISSRRLSASPVDTVRQLLIGW